VSFAAAFRAMPLLAAFEHIDAYLIDAAFRHCPPAIFSSLFFLPFRRHRLRRRFLPPADAMMPYACCFYARFRAYAMRC